MREMKMTGIKEDLETRSRRMITAIYTGTIIGSVAEVTLAKLPQNKVVEQGTGIGATNYKEDRKGPGRKARHKKSSDREMSKS